MEQKKIFEEKMAETFKKAMTDLKPHSKTSFKNKGKIFKGSQKVKDYLYRTS